jgi:hypothetical protein
MHIQEGSFASACYDYLDIDKPEGCCQHHRYLCDEAYLGLDEGEGGA